jgi:ubiquitin-protein ligase
MPVSDDMLRWKAVIKGLPNTSWEGGLFHLAIEFPQGYPFKPFKLWLETEMYHPNVASQRGGPCSPDEYSQNFASSMLRRWSPAHTVRKVLTEVHRVIVTPDLDDPMDAVIADQFQHRRSEYEETVKRLVRSQV